MPLPRLPLQVFEAFEHVARLGSMQGAAREMGMSISSVSHHVARLEEALGVTLLDRSSRPFSLTREGREMLHHLTAGLQHLRRATNETAIGGLLGTRSLHIGIVEDFESNVAPELAVVLAGRMPNAKLSIRNVLSHEAPDLLRRGKLDISIASEVDAVSPNLTVFPILREPYVLVAPSDFAGDGADLLKGRTTLPFLRFNPDHQIGRQIEAHLARNRIVLPERVSFDSVQSIMAVVANGDGWSILTPVGFARAQRFAERTKMLPLPLATFSRQISLTARNDFDMQTARAVADLVQQNVMSSVMRNVVSAYPWLDGTVSIGPSQSA